ncbi:MAG TPA: protein kinase [Polyangiaceae bacterium]|nr:protein kinase [Polyangiaceae bacterium]
MFKLSKPKRLKARHGLPDSVSQGSFVYRALSELDADGAWGTWLGEQRDSAGNTQPVLLKHTGENNRTRAGADALWLEALLTLKLNGPQVVPLLDYGVLDGRPFAVYGFEEGVFLAQIIEGLRERGRRLPSGVAVGIILQACDLVRRLHKLSLDDEEAGGFVHGSLCPRNFLLTERGDVKVMGLIGARPIGRVVGREHVPAAALAYASPELLSGAPVTAAVDVHSLGAVLQELLGAAPAADGERDDLGAIVRDLLRAGPSAGFTNVDNFAAALQDAVRRTGTVVARQSISAQVRGVCEQYLLERRRQVRSLREIEWADQREAAASAPPPSEDVEQLTEAESAGGAEAPEPAEASLALGEYQEDGGDDAVTRIYDGEDLESEGPSQPQAWMHDSNPPEGARQGWSRWVVVGLLGVLVAVASGAAVMASRSVARAPREVPTAETRVAAASAGNPSTATPSAAPKGEGSAANAADGKPPAAEAPSAATSAKATAPAAAVTEETDDEAEEAPARGTTAARRSSERGAGRAVLRKVAATPKRAPTRAASAEAPARAEAEPATVGVSDLPEAPADAEPAAPPSPPPAAEPKPAAAKPADGDLVIEEGQPKLAYLTVDANPYATVYIDGDKKGVTPLVRIELQPGLHRMIARTEDGRTKRFTLQLDAGKTETVKVTWGEGE